MQPSTPYPTPYPRLVSVSTSGSKGVQQQNRWSYQRYLRRFSIHKRIEGGATVAIPRLMENFVSFSIHKRIEGGATSPQVGEFSSLCKFQYPQADRRGCNAAWNLLAEVEYISFSIHKRIEGGATVLRRDRVIGRYGFSIHKRIEGGATYFPSSFSRVAASFSIHKRIEGGATPTT